MNLSIAKTGFEMASQGIKKFIKNLKGGLQESALDTENIMSAFSIFGLLSLPVYYFINSHLLGELSGNQIEIGLRIFAGILCFLLILKRYFSPKLLAYLPMVWFITLLVFMPIFCTFMLFKNHFSAAWMLNYISMLILMILLVNHLVYVTLLILGTVLGILAYYFSLSNPFPFSLNPTPLTVLDIANTTSISLVMGMIFSRKKGMIERAKLEAMRALGSNIAHELRTPLASIRAGMDGINIYLPKLLESYELAKKQDLPVPDISPEHYQILSNLTNTLLEEVTLSNTMIDMMLTKIHPNLPFKKPHPCSVNDCVNNALKRYPFNENEAKWVHVQIEKDFIFEGEELLLVHVLFNLLKNALFAIQEAGKGEIYIWTELGPKKNILHFKDTARGLSPALERTLFRPFHTSNYNGTGLGLAFCRSVMDQFQGSIDYQTQYGAYLQFSLHFKP
jgi:signal transduction histidine kinase